METQNRQSAAKPLSNGERSTTIPQGSTLSNAGGKQPVYLKVKFVIYQIKNKVNNKVYIGSASFYDKRVGTHVSRLRRNKHNNQHLQSSWFKYGEENFEFSILEYSTKAELRSREQYWIDATNCCNPQLGYNIATKAESSRLGTKMPESAKKKIGDFWRGKKFSEERIKNIRLARTLEQGKAVCVFDKTHNFLYEFCSVSEASRNLNISASAIVRQCKHLTGSKRTYKNAQYIFRYKDIVCSA